MCALCYERPDWVVNCLKQDNAKLLGSIWFDGKKLGELDLTRKQLEKLQEPEYTENRMMKIVWVAGDNMVFTLAFPRHSLIPAEPEAEVAWIRIAEAWLFFNHAGSEGSLTLEEQHGNGYDGYIVLGEDLRQIPADLYAAAHAALATAPA